MPITATLSLEVPALEGISRADDLELIEVMRKWAQARRAVDAGLAILAGVVAARSSLELGYDGLAQRAGARTADALVSQLTGTSGQEARAITSVGTMMSDPAAWLGEVATRVAAGDLSIGAAAAIQSGLGAPSPTVAADDLADAAHELLASANFLPPEKVARQARELRDELDEAGVVDRESELREKRFLRLTRQADGMTRIVGLLDPESAALVTDAVDAVTSPRRGGPRFVDATAAARAEDIALDDRTTGQLALDALVEMVRIAVAADDGRVFGTRKPAVRVHVTATDLARGTGVAHLEGQTSAVSVATVERLACGDGFLAIEFSDGGANSGAALRLGRSRRTFSDAQRAVLAAIWGGCAVGGCDRPPSWCEAHHIDEWLEDLGPTDVSNGILLCRHDHLLVHNNGWKIRRRGNDYFLEPPRGDPLHAAAIPLIPKNPVYHRGRANADARSRGPIRRPNAPPPAGDRAEGTA
ncbi:HNH endonuclease signature motif containing protein [Lacisediminihabitans profunda]|nr:HNH endonuclease signature motif containing protein [Lacisediminihabitans profunda]